MLCIYFETFKQNTPNMEFLSESASRSVTEHAPGIQGNAFHAVGPGRPGCRLGKAGVRQSWETFSVVNLSHRTLGKAHKLVTAQLPYGQNGRKVKPASKNFMRILDNACKACSTVPGGKWQFCC